MSWFSYLWGGPSSEKEKTIESSSTLPLLSDETVEERTPAVPLDRATTANGALSYNSTGDARLDLFGKVCRDTSEQTLVALLEASWKVNPLDTLKIIFYIRDCRGGTGERDQFFRALHWLERKNFQALLDNIQHIPFYGRYKDLLHVAATFGGVIRCYAYNTFALQLQIDQKLIGTAEERKISLAGKYAPSENGYYDKLCGATAIMCRNLGCDKKTYRKKYLSPLRKATNVVERNMTDLPEDWHSINFSHVPSVALKKYKKAWLRHEKERYTSWLDEVKAGKVKMNVLRLMPYQIVEPYLKSPGVSLIEDPLVEAQWFSFVEQTRTKLVETGGRSLKVVSVIDTSGSMYSGRQPKPITVALALGLVLAELTEGPYKGKFITFSNTPIIEDIFGVTLREKISGISKASWGMSTNIQAVYDLILNSTVSAENSVDTVFVFSDMQWNQASRNEKTNWEVLDKKFTDRGLKRPRFVFWNVNGTTFDFPMPSAEENACYISGFSNDVLQAILENRNLSPVDLMLSVIRSERYDRISLPVF